MRPHHQKASHLSGSADARSRGSRRDGRHELRRAESRGGLVIAFVGSDGSGKSTVAREIARWLSRKVPVVHLYFGTGDGPVSLPRRVLRRVGALVAAWRRRDSSAPPRTATATPETEPGPTSSPGWARTLWRVAWAFLVAREKRQRLATARRARSRGIVVVCDRYPQADIMGYNDGPLLGRWIDHPSKWRRALASRELAVYRSFTRFPPDLVVKLHVTPALAARRKEIASLDLLQRKADGIKRLEYPNTTAVLDLDADRPLESVLQEVKDAIWSRI